MTVITLNLLAEEQRALEARARDPFKVALVLGVLVVTIAVVAGFLVSIIANKQQVKAERLRNEYEAMGESAIAEAEVRYRWTESLSKDVVTINTRRVLFAEQLAMVKDVVPATIQLANLTLTVGTETKQLEPPPPPTEGEELARPAKPSRPKKIEVVTLRMDGRAVSGRPEIEVDEFLKTLREDEKFSANLEEVELRSIARAALTDPLTGATSNPSAFFVIECRMRGEP